MISAIVFSVKKPYKTNPKLRCLITHVTFLARILVQKCEMCWEDICVVACSLTSVEEPLVFCLFAHICFKQWYRCRQKSGFNMCLLQNVQIPFVLLCVRSKVVKNHWFYHVFAHNERKTADFMVFSLKTYIKDS